MYSHILKKAGRPKREQANRHSDLDIVSTYIFHRTTVLILGNDVRRIMPYSCASRSWRFGFCWLTTEWVDGLLYVLAHQVLTSLYPSCGSRDEVQDRREGKKKGNIFLYFPRGGAVPKGKVEDDMIMYKSWTDHRAMNIFAVYVARRKKKRTGLYLRSSIIRVPPERRRVICRWRRA